MALPQVSNRGVDLRILKISANMLSYQSWHQTSGENPNCGLSVGTTPHRKTKFVTLVVFALPSLSLHFYIENEYNMFLRNICERLRRNFQSHPRREYCHVY
jgi:hypothetical protein